MTDHELKKLKKSLPKNYAKTISENTGYHPVYIYKVLTGMRNNDQIIQQALILAETEKQKELKRKERIKNL